MQKLKNNIRDTEEMWLLPLLNHCNNLFSEVFLPSHDHLHHYRVWNHAKELILILAGAGFQISPELPEQLMLAAFFHDTGLIYTRDEKHGLESRRLCEEFFNRGDHALPEGYHEILEAIEHHDDKSFRRKSFTGEPAIQLLGLLGTSDDMDAFGYTGIYRYAEIYLLRGIKPEDLPGRVLENLNNRFNNLKSILENLSDFISRQEIRFWITCEFYLGLSEAYAGEAERPDWKPELIHVFRECIDKQINLLKPDRLMPKLAYEREIQHFFMLLDEENSILSHV